jgi:hypothetical protein
MDLANSTERQGTRSIILPKLVSDAVQHQLIDTLTTNGRMAGKR